MADQTHLTLQECTGLYALDALGPEDIVAFETHLSTCDVCAAEVRSLREAAATLPFGITMVDPPARLRDRVLAVAVESAAGSVTPFASRPRQAAATTRVRPVSRAALWAGWTSAAATALLAAGAALYASDLRLQLRDAQGRLSVAVARLQETQAQLTTARADAAGVRTSLALLTSPDVLDLRLNGLTPARQARGRALMSRTRGLLFAASNLPPLPPARVYQLWYLTGGAPVSAGLVQPDAQGTVMASFDVPTDVPNTTGFAVSIEPEGGVPAPTGALYLATQ
jgi:anti-sigma-K factor RskA